MKNKVLFPLGDRVVVKPLADKVEKTESGIILPETQKQVLESEIIAISSALEQDVKVGDIVLHDFRSGVKLESGEIVIEISDLFAIVNK